MPPHVPIENVALGMGPEVPGHFNEANIGSFKIDGEMEAVLQEPNFDSLKSAPYLQKHQQQCKATANKWKNELRSALLSVNDDIIAYHSVYIAFFDDMQQLARVIDTDAKARKDIILCLEELKNEVKQQKEKTVNMANKLNAFAEALRAHKSDLTGDLNKIEAKSNSDMRSVDDIRANVKTLEDGMKSGKKLMKIGGCIIGGVAIIGGALMFIGCPVSAPVAVTLIKYGSVAVGSGGAITTLKGASRYLGSRLKRGTDVEILACKVALLEGRVNKLVEHIEKSCFLADKLSNAWSQLERDYESVISALQSTETAKPVSVIMTNRLKDGKNRLDTLRDDAQKIKENFMTRPIYELRDLKKSIESTVVETAHDTAAPVATAPVTTVPVPTNAAAPDSTVPVATAPVTTVPVPTNATAPDSTVPVARVPVTTVPAVSTVPSNNN